jgi:hypothetical protein
VSTNIQATIEIKGKDSASATLNSVEKSLRGVASAGGDMAASTSAAGEHAGKLERGFMGLKDIIGGVAEGPLAAVADRMGGIEAIVQGFGPGFGAVGVAVAGVAMGASLLYEQVEKARKAALQMQIDTINAALADKELLAQRYGLTREMLGLAEKTTGVKGVQLEIEKEAVAIAKLEAEILKMQQDGETEGIARREAKITAARNHVTELSHQLLQEKGLNAEDEKRKATAMYLADHAGSLLERERKAELTLDRKGRLDAKAAVLADKRAAIEEKIATLQRQQSSILTRTVAGMTELLGLKTQLHDVERSTQAIATEGEAITAERKAKAEAAGQAARERRKREAEERRKALDDYYAAETQLHDKLVADADARAKAILDLQDRVRKQAIGAAASPADKAKLAADDLKIRADRERADIAAKLAGDDEQRTLRLLELDQRAASERMRIETDLQKAKDETAKKANDDAKAQIDGVFAIAGALRDGLGQMDLDKRAAAALDATIAGAQAFYQFSLGNIPGGIAATAAAARWASVAIGGGGDAGAGAPAGGGGMGQATAQAARGGGSSGGAVVINFNKGFYGDAATTAKGIAGTMKSIAKSGIPAFKGA